METKDKLELNDILEVMERSKLFTYICNEQGDCKYLFDFSQHNALVRLEFGRTHYQGVTNEGKHGISLRLRAAISDTEWDKLKLLLELRNGN